MISPIKNVFLNVNNICQFRCDYCWVRKTKGEQLAEAKKTMTPEILEKGYKVFQDYQKEVLNYYPNNLLNFIFATKEPLIHWDNLLKPFIEKLNLSNWDDNIQICLLTNGQLFSKEVADFCIANKVHVLMSLDGNLESNNKNRIFYQNGINKAFKVTIQGANNLPPQLRHFTFTLNKNTILYLRDSLEFLVTYPHSWTRFNYNLYSNFTDEDWDTIHKIFKDFIEAHDMDDLQFLHLYSSFSPFIDENRGIIMGIDYQGRINIKKPFHSSIPWLDLNKQLYAANKIYTDCGTVFEPHMESLNHYIKTHGINYCQTNFENIDGKCKYCQFYESCHPTNIYTEHKPWIYYMESRECKIKETNLKIAELMRRKMYGF